MLLDDWMIAVPTMIYKWRSLSHGDGLRMALVDSDGRRLEMVRSTGPGDLGLGTFTATYRGTTKVMVGLLVANYG